MRFCAILLVIGTALCALAPAAAAVVPNHINFQGTLADSGGNGITGTRSLQFHLYADSVGGTALWNETHSSVTVTDGLFHVSLGTIQSFPDTLFSGQDLWLETTVGSETLSPREKVATVPYAFLSQNANNVSWADSSYYAAVSDTASYALEASADLDWVLIDNNVYRLSGNVGIGISGPAEKLDVDGTVQMAGFKMGTGASDGYILTCDTSGTGTWQPGLAGSGTANYIPKFTGALALGNSNIYQNGTYVGINMTNPSSELSLYGSAGQLRIYNPATGTGYNGFVLGFVTDNSLDVGVWNRETGSLRFGTNDAERILIESDGDVGIGTSTPGYKLDVNGTIGAATVNTGLGNNELFAMNQNVRTTDAVSFATVNTGLGNNELYAMNQNVQTTDNPTFNQVHITDYGYALDGFHIGETMDPGADNLVVDGNTSIGTTAATHRLTVSNTTADDVLRLIGPDGIHNEGWGARLNFGDGDEVYLDEDMNGGLEIYSMNRLALMNLNVGIGTLNPNPTTKLEVAGTVHSTAGGFKFPDGTSQTTAVSVSGTSGCIPQFTGSTSLGNSSLFQYGSYIGIGIDQPSADLNIYGSVGAIRIHNAGTGFGYNGLVLGYIAEASVDAAIWNRENGYLKFGTLDAERMRIEADGDVGIGTAAPGYKLDVAGSCHATSFPTSSDERLKTNVQQLTGVLDKIDKIRGVAFDWNSKYEEMGRSSGHREIGVIAQEIEAQFPELVTTWGDENYRAVDYGRLTAVLIEAVKELKAENRDLKKEIEELRAAIK